MKSHPWGNNPHFTDEEKDRFLARAQAIFDEGVCVAREGKTGPARFEGRDLDSMECITFFDGVLSVMPSFIHPYGGLGDPRRPGSLPPSPEELHAAIDQAEQHNKQLREDARVRNADLPCDPVSPIPLHPQEK